MNIFTNFFAQFYARPSEPADIERTLIRRESKIGRDIFGPVPKGVRREFFCLDENTWIWHEEKGGELRVTRYRIKPNEIIKSVNDGQYERISAEEARRLAEAAKLYYKRVQKELYRKDPMLA